MSEVKEVKLDLAALREIAPWIRGELAERLDPAQVEVILPGIELAVQEIAVNIVEHGFVDNGTDLQGRQFRVELDHHDGVVQLTLIDNGPAYDPDQIAEPDPDQPQVGGYGLMIVRQLTSEFGVERDGDLNKTRLCFEIPLQTTA